MSVCPQRFDDCLDVDSPRVDLIPAENVAACPQPPLAEHQLGVARDPDRLQHAQLFDACSEAGQVAEVAAMALADLDFSNRDFHLPPTLLVLDSS